MSFRSLILYPVELQVVDLAGSGIEQSLLPKAFGADPPSPLASLTSASAGARRPKEAPPFRGF